MDNALSAVLTALEIVGIIVGAAATLTLAWVSLTNRVQKQTVDQLKELTNALSTRVDSLEQEREELKVRVETLEQENSVLRSIVTGEVKVAELTVLIRDFQEEIRMTLGDIRYAVTKP